jgi:hypothetical protein
MQWKNGGKTSWCAFKNNERENFLSTHIFIDENSLENIEDIEYCPMIFQPYIEKEYELRILYLDGEFLPEKSITAKMPTGE